MILYRDISMHARLAYGRFCLVLVTKNIHRIVDVSALATQHFTFYPRPDQLGCFGIYHNTALDMFAIATQSWTFWLWPNDPGCFQHNPGRLTPQPRNSLTAIFTTMDILDSAIKPLNVCLYRPRNNAVALGIPAQMSNNLG